MATNDQTDSDTDTDDGGRLRARIEVKGRLLEVGYGAYLTLAAHEHGARGFGQFTPRGTVFAYIELEEDALDPFLKTLEFHHSSTQLLTLDVETVECAIAPDIEYYRTPEGEIDSEAAPEHDDFGRFTFRYPDDVRSGAADTDTDTDTDADADLYAARTRTALHAQRDLDRLLLLDLNMNVRGLCALMREVVQNNSDGFDAMTKELERLRQSVKSVEDSADKMAGELRRLRGAAKRRRKRHLDPAIH